ncbi:MAG: hypothetical protein KAH20_08325 [Methylococcales bacterium]|nr:hypothetical protein [Methylococcales bacterium]
MRQSLFIVILCSFIFFSQPASAEFRKDLALHAGLSLVISTASYHFYRQTLELTPTQSRVAAFFTTLAVGAIKEATDDKFSGSDMAANAGGTALGVAIAFDF